MMQPPNRRSDCGSPEEPAQDQRLNQSDSTSDSKNHPALLSGFHKALKVRQELYNNLLYEEEEEQEKPEEQILPPNPPVQVLSENHDPSVNSDHTTQPKSGVQNYRKARPCSVEWDSLAGTDRFRICNQCNVHIYNFKNVSFEEAAQIVFKREGKSDPCFYRRADGTFLTSDCPAGQSTSQKMIWTASIVAVCVLIGVYGIFAMSTSTVSSHQPAKKGLWIPTALYRKAQQNGIIWIKSGVRRRPSMLPPELYTSTPVVPASQVPASQAAGAAGVVPQRTPYTVYKVKDAWVIQR
jgi:hypothetical protein